MKPLLKSNFIGFVAFALLISFNQAHAATPEVLHNFLGTPADGSYPLGQLVQGSDGAYYGTTYAGGTGDYGTVFKWVPGKLTILASFDYYTTGGYPYAGLIQGSDGNFYGTTSYGGVNGYGTVFKITPKGKITVLASFDYSNTGGIVYGPVIQATDGNFYGTTYEGGTYGYGTVFRVKPNGMLKVLVNLDGTNTGGYPSAGVTQGKDGNFYGTTQGGGTYNLGTVYKVKPNGALTVLASFDGTKGGDLAAPLTIGPDGFFYSVAYNGGKYGYGTLFSVNPANGGVRVLFNFDNAFNGGNPFGYYLVVDGNNLYGATYQYGASGYGTIFRYSVTPPGTFTVLANFDYTNTGGYLYTGPILGSDGFLYGVTYQGGKSGYGNLFRLTK